MNFIKTLIITLLLCASFSSCNNHNEEDKKIFKCLDVIASTDNQSFRLLKSEMIDERKTKKIKPYFEILSFIENYSTNKYNAVKYDSIYSLDFKIVYENYIKSIDSVFSKTSKSLFCSESLNEIRNTYLTNKKIDNRIDLAIEIINIKHYLSRIVLESISGDCNWFEKITYEVDSSNCKSDSLVIIVNGGKYRSDFPEQKHYRLDLINKYKSTNYDFKELNKTLFKIKVLKKDIGTYRLWLNTYYINQNNLSDSSKFEIFQEKI